MVGTDEQRARKASKGDRAREIWAREIQRGKDKGGKGRMQGWEGWEGRVKGKGRMGIIILRDRGKVVVGIETSTFKARCWATLENSCDI